MTRRTALWGTTAHRPGTSTAGAGRCVRVRTGASGTQARLEVFTEVTVGSLVEAGARLDDTHELEGTIVRGVCRCSGVVDPASDSVRSWIAQRQLPFNEDSDTACSLLSDQKGVALGASAGGVADIRVELHVEVQFAAEVLTAFAEEPSVSWNVTNSRCLPESRGGRPVRVMLARADPPRVSALPRPSVLSWCSLDAPSASPRAAAGSPARPASHSEK